jgi:hypothetical protein
MHTDWSFANTFSAALTTACCVAVATAPFPVSVVADDEFKALSVRMTVQSGSAIEGKAIRIGVRVLGTPSVRALKGKICMS